MYRNSSILFKHHTTNHKAKKTAAYVRCSVLYTGHTSNLFSLSNLNRAQNTRTTTATTEIKKNNRNNESTQQMSCNYFRITCSLSLSFSVSFAHARSALASVHQMKMFYMYLADRLAQKGLDCRHALIQAFRLFCVVFASSSIAEQIVCVSHFSDEC